MAINLVVAVTDYEWFSTLKQQHGITEVNFWSPSAKQFRSLQPGELFLFKLHSPHNMIVGGGIFAHSNILPCYLAWQSFSTANGAHSLEEMELGIAKYRTSNQRTFDIGCRILTQPFFFDEPDWIAQPRDWSPNIVTYKRYNTGEEEGYRLWEEVQARLARRRDTESEESEIGEPPALYGSPHLVTPRLGQGAFRTLVTDVYSRRCAVTRERTLPALEAAHIVPFSKNGPHEAKNGLLLRRDIHSLFDAGYVTVTPELNFEVSRSIREEFENGHEYYSLHGTRIQVPKKPDLRPHAEWLSWHNENVYKG